MAGCRTAGVVSDKTEHPLQTKPLVKDAYWEYEKLNSIVYGSDAPVRISQSVSHVSYDRAFTFEETYDSASLVADVIITEWLGELNEGTLGRYIFQSVAY